MVSYQFSGSFETGVNDI